jgi:hypothetical protein
MESVMASRDTYKRMTDLWRPGAVMVYEPGTPSDDSVEPPLPARPDLLLWIQKLNRFEQDEVRADAGVAQARAQMVLRDLESDDYVAARNRSEQMDIEQLVEAIVAAAYSTHMAKAANSVQADTDWHDRLDVVQRTNLAEASDEEKALVEKLAGEYYQEVAKRVAERDEEERARVSTLGLDVLRKEYIDGFVNQRGMDVYMREMNVGEIAFGVRTCEAILCADATDEHGSRCLDGYHHAACTHERLYEQAKEVRELPDELYDRYRGAFNAVNVAAGQAKGSGSRQHSSAASAPPSALEGSTASTPVATSPEPGGISA